MESINKNLNNCLLNNEPLLTKFIVSFLGNYKKCKTCEKFDTIYKDDDCKKCFEEKNIIYCVCCKKQLLKYEDWNDTCDISCCENYVCKDCVDNGKSDDIRCCCDDCGTILCYDCEETIQVEDNRYCLSCYED